jgi:gliotoxin/aspirochlorine biosynthesis thioredoxin reductase
MQAHVPAFELNGPFTKDLGLGVAPQGHINTLPPFFSTNVPGVHAAGDCATAMKAVPTASMMGSFVAVGLVHAMQAEDDVED